MDNLNPLFLQCLLFSYALNIYQKKNLLLILHNSESRRKRQNKIMWQDYAITLIIYMFVIVTIPQVIDVLKKKTRLNLLTAGPTAFGNYLMAAVFASLGLWISVTSSLLIATLWLIIFIGSWKK